MAHLTAEQQIVRSRGVSGSEIAAVAGVNPNCGPLQVWLRKTGRVVDAPQSHHIERGQHLEPALVHWYEARTQRVVSHRGDHQQTLVCPTNPLVIATPDGLVHAAGRGSRVVAVLEVKAPFIAHDWGEPGTDEIPEQYVPQVTWEMAAAEVDTAEVAALVNGDLAIYHVAFDGELFAALLESAERFWRDYVETDHAPPVDGSDAAKEWLLSQHPRAVRDIIEGCERDAELMRAMHQAQADRDEAEERYGKAKQQLMAIIGDHEGLHCSAGRISWRNNKDGQKTDWEALARDAGVTDEQIAKFTTVKPGPRVFRPTFKEG